MVTVPMCKWDGTGRGVMVYVCKWEGCVFGRGMIGGRRGV